MKTPEGYEKDQIRAYLDTMPNCWYFCPTTYGFGKSGVPDIVACLDGMFVAIEVKRPGKEPTTIQRRRMEEIIKSGGRAVVGASAGVIEWLAIQPTFVRGGIV